MVKRNLKYIIILMSAAMVGLIILQFYWISNALKVQEDYFNQNVSRAMNEVVRKIEKQATAKFIARNIQNLQSYHPSYNNSIQLFSNGHAVTGNVIIKRDSIGKIKRYVKKIHLNPETSGSSAPSEEIKLNKGDIFNLDTAGVNVESVLKNFFSSSIQKAPQILQEIFMDFSGGNYGIHDLEPEYVDSLINSELSKAGINLHYDFGVINTFFRSVVLSKTGEHLEQLIESPYKIPLNPRSLMASSEYLSLYFPHKSHYLYTQMSFVLIASAILICLIIFCFAYTIYTIVKQKKISEMKTDFINNMTHEFKTPVSTILLASQALKEPRISEDKERVNKLGSVIYEENNRIAGHVERVLQIAAMEKENFKLNRSEININELIEKVVENMQIQAEFKGGRITSLLNAQHAELSLDEGHFTNVISNLLDNAIKYCVQAPEVIISTEDKDNGIIIKVKDNGIGLSADQQNRIFEQFYRVPTGNIHDVKGFGLGLYYVKSIVTMHGGSIKVESEKGRGSTFEIVLSAESRV